MIALIDTSAWIWAEQNPAEAATQDLLTALSVGTIASCAPVRLEVLRGAENVARFDQMSRQLGGLVDAPVDARVSALATSIQRDLASLPGSKYRSTPAIDLLVAAAAIQADMPLIHRDRDFETIAEITHQPLRWLGPR
jgi:predicted nucleic acid-binding protein